MDKNICLTCDNNYVRHCIVTMLSVVESSGSNYLFHLIVDGSLSKDNKKKLSSFISSSQLNIKLYEVDTSILKGVQFRKTRPLTEAAYLRVLMSSILDSSIHTVLYLDCDILVVNDISPIFDLDISDYALAATKDITNRKDPHRFQIQLPYMEPYFCSGMMYVNLDYWRDNNSEKALVNFSKREREVFFHDQDALNYVFKGKWYRLSPKWNKFYPIFYDKTFFENSEDYYHFERNPMIIHFYHYFKPWNKFYWYGRKWRKYQKYYLKLLAETPWKDYPLNNSHSKEWESVRMLLSYSTKKGFDNFGLLWLYDLIVSLKNIFR